MSIAQTVQSSIEAMPAGKIFDYKALPGYAQSPGAVIKAVGRMVDGKRLERLSKGKFYVPEESKLLGWKLKPSARELIDSIIYKNGRLRGYVTGMALYNGLGLTTQIPVTITLAINGRRRNGRVGGLRINTVVTHVPVKEKDVRLLQYLDVLRKIDRIMDSDRDVSLMKMGDYILKLSDREQSRMVDLAIGYYSPKTRAVLGLVLSSRQLPVPERLRHSLNPVTTFRLRLFNEANWPLAKEWNIRG